MNPARQPGTPLHVFRLPLLFAVLAGLAAGAAPAVAQAQGDAAAIDVPVESAIDCARCHADPEFLAGKGETPEDDAALLVTDELLAQARHTGIKCAECHVQYGEYPHQPHKFTKTCGECHEPQQADWGISAHAANFQTRGDAPDCMYCHDSHQPWDNEDRRSRTHALNQPALCGECHGDPGIIATYFSDPADTVAARAVTQYHETVHGTALTKMGLVVSATCADCHSPHRVLPADDERSMVNPTQVVQTCGKCHVGIVETWEASSHGRARAEGRVLEEGGHQAPVCTGCHNSHGVVAVGEGWKADVVEECGGCHERLYETYFDTYHGKVTRLGAEITAKCSDCHTAHSNLPADDPKSTVYPANRVATCGACHENATPAFTQYYPHGDHQDREKYPELFWTYAAMSGLLLGTLGFFGVHTALWLGRGLSARRTENGNTSGGRHGS
jgi:hypothetical protein